MQTSKLDIGGGVVMWTVDSSDRQKLLDGLTDLGLEDHLPKPRTPKAILHESLKGRYANSRSMVRPLEKKSAFTIVSEQRGDDINQYDNVMSVIVDEDGDISVSPYNETEQWFIQQAYDNAAGVVPSQSVTRMLVSVLASMHGIALKPSGGVYWLPERRLERWSKIASVVEKAACESGKNSVFLLRSVADADAMRTVRAGIISDISRALEEIERDLSEGDLGERGLEERVARAKGLHDKLREYEGVLGDTLTDVNEMISEAARAASEALLLASSKQVLSFV